MKDRFIHALGMMSGTSLDGVDAAMITTDGETIAEFGASAYQPYTAEQTATLRQALGCWPGMPGVAQAAELSVAAHAQAALAFPQTCVIGYHGQTLAHDPQGRGTHQAGCGAALARQTGRAVVWDFRSEDVRRGGEGAPLAPFFHWACANWAVSRGVLPSAPVCFLNLGGVGNLTWVDPAAAGPDAAGACMAFDSGPANAPINDLMADRLRLPRDEGGALALAGRVSQPVIEQFSSHPFFARRPPKSLDRDDFARLSQAVSHLDDADAAATLTEAAAVAVAQAMSWVPQQPAAVLVCGGGRHNRAMMAALQRHIPADIRPVETAGLDGDMLEAQAFGWLAVRVLRGLPTSGPATTAAPARICGGRISPPSRDTSLRDLIG